MFFWLQSVFYNTYFESHYVDTGFIIPTLYDKEKKALRGKVRKQGGRNSNWDFDPFLSVFSLTHLTPKFKYYSCFRLIQDHDDWLIVKQSGLKAVRSSPLPENVQDILGVSDLCR